MKFPLTVFCLPHCSTTKVPSSTAITGDTSSCIDQDPLAPPSPWGKDSPAGLSLQSISLEQPGSHGHLVCTSWLCPGWATAALWHCRAQIQCWAMPWMIYAQPRLEKQMHVSDKTIFISFSSPSFCSKVLEGFPAIDKIIFTKLKCKICSRAC